jgi:histidyl-tRNA synthetase
MKFANGLGVQWVAMIGENEIKNQRILLKNMISGEQDEVNFKGMINKIQN